MHYIEPERSYAAHLLTVCVLSVSYSSSLPGISSASFLITDGECILPHTEKRFLISLTRIIQREEEKKEAVNNPLMPLLVDRLSRPNSTYTLSAFSHSVTCDVIARIRGSDQQCSLCVIFLISGRPIRRANESLISHEAARCGRIVLWRSMPSFRAKDIVRSCIVFIGKILRAQDVRPPMRVIEV